MTKVFISWSGPLSQKLAEEIRDWLPSVLQFVKPYFTPSDIEKGAKWNSEISTELSDSDIGIICLTRANLSRPWILFEAGALSKNLSEARVSSILFGLDSAEVSGPLASFQNTNFEKSDFKKLVSVINDSGGESKLDDATMTRVFEKWWPDLEQKVNSIMNEDDENDENEGLEIRSDRDMIEEILKTTRLMASRPSRFSSGSIPRGLVRDLEEVLKTIESEAGSEESGHYNAILQEAGQLQQRAVRFLMHHTDRFVRGPRSKLRDPNMNLRDGDE